MSSQPPNTSPANEPIEAAESLRSLQQKSPFSRLHISILALHLVPTLIVSFIIQIASQIRPELLDHNWFSQFLGSLLYLIGLPVAWLIIRKLPDTRFPNTADADSADKTPAYKQEKLSVCAVLILCIAGYGIAYFFNAILAEINLHLTEDPNIFRYYISPLDMAMIFYVNVIAAPLGEEIFFRRLLFNKLAGYGEGIYVIYSALMFGIIHMNFLQFFYTVPFGILLGIVMYRTEKLRYPIIIHAFLNLMATGSAILMHFNLDVLARAWPRISLCIALAGALVILIILIRKRKTFSFKKGTLAPLSGADIFFNIGAVLLSVYLLKNIFFPVI